jgi:hypothetical protein
MSEQTPLVSNNILSAVFILFGALLILPSFNTIYLLQASRDWPVVEGQVVSSELETRWVDVQPPKTNEALARVWFTYQVKDKQYFSQNLRFLQDYTKDIESSQETLQHYPVGRKIQVKYRPSDPSIAVVEKSAVPTFDCVKLGMGMLFVMIGSIAIIGMLFPEKRRE